MVGGLTGAGRHGGEVSVSFNPEERRELGRRPPEDSIGPLPRSQHTQLQRPSPHTEDPSETPPHHTRGSSTAPQHEPSYQHTYTTLLVGGRTEYTRTSVIDTHVHGKIFLHVYAGLHAREIRDHSGGEEWNGSDESKVNQQSSFLGSRSIPLVVVYLLDTDTRTCMKTGIHGDPHHRKTERDYGQSTKGRLHVDATHEQVRGKYADARETSA